MYDRAGSRKRLGLILYTLFATLTIFTLILARIWNLQHVPSNVSGDEVTFLNDVIRIVYFPDKASLFSLMGDGSQAAINFYYMSWIMRPFSDADAILGMRLSSVLLSLGVLAVFYFYMSTKVEKVPSLVATFLLGMNPAFLNFSRATWMSDGRGLGLIGGLLSFIFIERAVAKGQWIWAVPGGLLAGLALYGYLGNAIFPLSCLVYLGYMALRRRLPWKAALIQITLFGFTAFLVFLPQLVFNFQHLDKYTLRARSTSIASVDKPYYGRTDVLGVLGHQLGYTVLGFLILDPAVSGEGTENQRYVPPAGPVDVATRLLFFLGLGTTIFLARKDILLPSLAFAGAMTLSFLSQFPPNFARGFFALPFIYLIIAILIDKVWSLKVLRSYGQAALVFLIVGLGLWNGWYYLQWGGGTQLAGVRQPAIQYEQVSLWVETSKQHSAAGQADLVITSEEWERLTAAVTPTPTTGQLPGQ